jgi:hypothetical protein
MDQTLVEHFQAVIDALQLADADAKTMIQTTRKRRIAFGLEVPYVDADITQIMLSWGTARSV